MEDIKISVIIPIYNVEKYLRQCVESVLNQTYRNIEVILVDDSSPDCCPAICDEYAKRDSRVVVLHKRNGGLSDARNAGVKIATGNYGIFLDSDDYWTDNVALQQLVERLEITDADVLSFAYHKFDEDTGKVVAAFHADANMPANDTDTVSQLEYLTNHSLYIASAWNKLIRISLLHDLPFEKGKVSEDVEWCAKLMDRADTFDFLNLDFYCYRQRAGSISNSISEKSCVDLKDAILGCIAIANMCDSKKKEYLGRFSAYQYSTFIAVQSFVEKYPKSCIEQLDKKMDILKYYGNNRKVRYMYYGTVIFGLKLWCRIIRVTKPVWNTRRDKI